MTRSSTIYVREQGASVRRSGERLLVTKQRKKLMDLPLRHVQQLALIGNVQLTTPAAAALLERDIDVVFMSRGYRYRGRLMQNGSRFAELRLAQLELMQDETRCLRLARAIVVGKLHNQRAFLQRRLRQAETGAAATEALQRAQRGIADMARAAADAADLDQLRGYEGKAGAWYFGGLRALLDPRWQFTGRKYYPPPDPINAALSLGYALLTRDVLAAVQLVGLDPYLGFFHAIHYGRPSLALDVMEEFRPLLVDRLVLGMVARGELTAADFRATGRAKRPIELREAGAGRLLEGYAKRLATKVRHPRTGQQSDYRRCLELQVRQVAGVVLGKQADYQPMRAR